MNCVLPNVKPKLEDLENYRIFFSSLSKCKVNVFLNATCVFRGGRSSLLSVLHALGPSQRDGNLAGA